MRKFLDDADRIVTESEMENYFNNEMDAETKEEYGNFETYMFCCMLQNGGCLTEIAD